MVNVVSLALMVALLASLIVNFALVGQLQKANKAADVRPVVKAKWKRIDFKPCGHDYECSSCGWKNDMATHFCPNCGAMMEES